MTRGACRLDDQVSTRGRARTLAGALLLGVCMTAGLLFPPAAFADSEAPPRVELRVTSVVPLGTETQDGELAEYMWFNGFAADMKIRGSVWEWPAPLRIAPDDLPVTPPVELLDMRLRIYQELPPVAFDIRHWSRIKRKNGAPKGDPATITCKVETVALDGCSLRPSVTEGGARVWDATFTLPAKPVHLYLEVPGNFLPDGDINPFGLLAGGNRATWLFHVMRTKAALGARHPAEMPLSLSAVQGEG